MGSERIMKKENIDIIKEKVAAAQGLATAKVEYNFDELPEHDEINERSFFGIPAVFNNSMPKNTANVIYTM